MSDRFKESRGKKLLQLLNTQNNENKENHDCNLKEEVQTIADKQIIENYSNECLKNPDSDTTFEVRKDAEPIAHCSYNPPENKSANTEAAAYESFSEDDDDSVKDPNYKSSSSSRTSSKCIADLHADYKAKCLEQGVTAAHYEMYAKIFNTEFNISFFTPKKDRCELCVSYENATGSDKEKLHEKYVLHLEEKDLSRVEKENDKTKKTKN